ncbi:sentrin-specific protease 1-like [Olea europaea subsp. europaea]|uniref:Sentrin-specific protease 1-like n=1 Tax=Olea europaea subsp. europaea TaxID=158383 RepID=A0A8S0VAJ8_OLEEU|nr:sentrin-specific protease 1-like [Olea europaea subsp. europaea]
MSEESVPLITDTGVRQAHITDDDDDFVDPPRRCEVISHQETPCADEGHSEIRTNMQFLSESLTAMISSSMDEILRRFNDRKGCPVNEYEDTEAAIEGFEKIDEGSPTTEPASELPVKRDSRPARILRSPFVVGEGKEPWHDAGKTYRDWKVLEGIEPYVKVLPAIMKVLGISKKDPDYNESECKQMKVTIDSTLPQQTNDHDCGVFVILYALYILRDDRCAILHQFDAAKCRIDITSLLYKHQESYVKKARQAFKGEGIVIE